MRIWSSSRYGSSRADFVLGQLRWTGRVSTGGGGAYCVHHLVLYYGFYNRNEIVEIDIIFTIP